MCSLYVDVHIFLFTVLFVFLINKLRLNHLLAAVDLLWTRVLHHECFHVNFIYILGRDINQPPKPPPNASDYVNTYHKNHFQFHLGS